MILSMNIYESKVFNSLNEYLKNGGNYLKLTSSSHNMTRPVYKYYHSNIFHFDEELLHTNKSWLVYKIDDKVKVTRIN